MVSEKMQTITNPKKHVWVCSGIETASVFG